MVVTGTVRRAARHSSTAYFTGRNVSARAVGRAAAVTGHEDIEVEAQDGQAMAGVTTTAHAALRGVATLGAGGAISPRRLITPPSPLVSGASATVDRTAVRPAAGAPAIGQGLATAASPQTPSLGVRSSPTYGREEPGQNPGAVPGIAIAGVVTGTVVAAGGGLTEGSPATATGRPTRSTRAPPHLAGAEATRGGRPTQRGGAARAPGLRGGRASGGGVSSRLVTDGSCLGGAVVAPRFRGRSGARRGASPGQASCTPPFARPAERRPIAKGGVSTGAGMRATSYPTRRVPSAAFI